jgi:hypothetical protein
MPNCWFRPAKGKVMTAQKRPKIQLDIADQKRRKDIARLSVCLPRSTLNWLKIHAAQNDTTIRNVVTGLITREIAATGDNA